MIFIISDKENDDDGDDERHRASADAQNEDNEPLRSVPVLPWPGNVICESAGRAALKQEVRAVYYPVHVLHAVGRVTPVTPVTQPSRGYFYTTDEETERNKYVISRRL